MSARGINKVILVGRLGNDPEVRYIPNGGAVANLQVATSESWRDKQTGEMREQTEWHRVVLFGKLAEAAGEYLRKGAQVYIEGQLRTRSWEDNVTSLKFLLRPRAPCRCWDVHHSRTLRRNRSLSRMGSHRVLTRRKKVARKRKAVDVRPRSQSLSLNNSQNLLMASTMMRHSDLADFSDSPTMCGALPENDDEQIR